MLRHLKLKRSLLPRKSVRNYSNGYVVLLPEVPPGTYASSETNELLNRTKVPTSFKIDIQKCRDAIGLMSLNYESNVWKVEQLLKDPSYSREDLIKALDTSDLDYAVNIMTIVHILETLPTFDKLITRAAKARNLRLTNAPIHYATKEILADNPNNPQLRQIVFEGKLNGVELTPKSWDVVQQFNLENSNDSEKFRKHIGTANANFKHLLVDEAHLGDMSLSDLTALAKDKSNPKRGPWTLSLNQHYYDAFMESSPVPALRWNIWQAYNLRGATKELNNSVLIENIRANRRRIAQTLGYKNHSELILESKPAANVRNVKSMIATLVMKCKPQQKLEHERLQKFAASQGYDTALKPWDVAYWRKKEREHLYGLKELTFPFEETFQNLLKFTSKLFSIEYEKVSDNHFRIHDKSDLIGQFIVDPYRTPSKFPGTYTLRNKLFSTLIANFEPPLYGQPSKLTVKEVNSLYEYFGHLLQKAAAPNDESIPTDFRIPGHFLNLWLGNKKYVEENLGLKGEQLDNFLKSRTHFAATDICHELYLTDLDLELDLSTDFWYDLVKKMWPTYHSVELDNNKHLCSSNLLHFGSTYYSDLWSRMLGADCYRGFVDSRNPKDISVDGRRFFTSFLEYKKDIQASERFRSFRGRDPSADALLWSIGLQKLDKTD